jgi:hypothetical protein
MKASFKHGIYGPRHDPYAYNEITIIRANGDVIVYHQGMCDWIKINGVEVFRDFAITPKGIEILEKATGISFKSLMNLEISKEVHRYRNMSRQERIEYLMYQEADNHLMRCAM